MKVGPKSSLRPFLHRALHFLGVVISDLVLFRGCSSEIYFKK